MLRRLTVSSLLLVLSVGAGGALAIEDEPPVAGAFEPAGSLAEAREAHTATLLPDGRVLVAGGREFPDVFASAEVWDPASASLEPIDYLAEARWDHTATLLPDGRVLLVGGGGGQGEDDISSAEIWDPATNSFEPAGSLAEARIHHTATLLNDGRVLVTGGCCDATFGDVLASAEIWDPATNSFEPAGSLAEARLVHAATLLNDGRVLVVGGAGDDFLASAEIWDPATMTFEPAGSLAKTRAFHTATLLPDGRVLVVGGGTIDESFSTGKIASAEVWDPATASFGQAGSLSEARGDHTATLLPDGRVLMVGGRGLPDDVVPLAEVWAPSDG